jgi:hypothetical protein
VNDSPHNINAIASVTTRAGYARVHQCPKKPTNFASGSGEWYREVVENGGTAARIGFCCIVAGGGAALSVAACTDGPGIQQISLVGLSQAFCEKSLECGCAPLLLGQFDFVQPTSCEGWNLEQLFAPDEEGGDGYEGGYEGGYDDGNGDDDTAGGKITHNFDQACADRIAAAIAETSCDRLIPEIACSDYCNIYYGTRFEGQPCDASRDCAQGLVCRGECVDPCKLESVGEGESCEFAQCDAGLNCVETDTNDDGQLPPTCVRPDGGGGQPCGEETCSSASWCDTSDPSAPRCRARGGTGAECTGHSQCTTFYCPAGFCADLPGDGEPCSDEGDCRPGTLCVENEPDTGGTCAAVAPLCLSVVGIPFLVAGYEYNPYYY